MSQQPPPAPRQGRGCLFYGCIISVVLVLVGAVALYFGARFAIRTAVNLYTDEKPMVLPVVEMPDVNVEAVKQRVDQFSAGLDAGTNVPPLRLTSDEVNALIANHPEWKKLNGRVYVSIQSNQVKGQISIPLDEIGVDALKGRYLNGAAAFKVSLKDGVLVVTLESAEVKGNPIPEQMLASLRKENLAKDFYRDTNNAARLRKFESIEIEDGSIVVKARGAEPAK